MVPDCMLMWSVPAPKVTLPLIWPVPPAGKFSVLLPPVSVRLPPESPLSQMKVSFPAVGAITQAAKAADVDSNVNDVVTRKPEIQE
jgi:hypothetical protein